MIRALIALALALFLFLLAGSVIGLAYKTVTGDLSSGEGWSLAAVLLVLGGLSALSWNTLRRLR